MEDYEKDHAAAWQDEDELQRRRDSRNQSPNVSSTSATNSISTRNSPSSGGAIGEFNIRNRFGNAYQSGTTLQPPPNSNVERPFHAKRQGHANPNVQPGNSIFHSASRPTNGEPVRRQGPRRARNDHQPPQETWVKIKSKDDRREARIQKRTEEAKEKELFLERPDDLETYQYQLFYLWPSADIPMEQLIDHYGKDVLQELQYTTQSYIEFDASQSLIRVRSSDENAVRHVVLRIGNLLRELIAKVNSSMHVRLVQYPTRGTDTAYINLRPNAFAEIVYPCLEYQCLGDSIDGKPDPRSLQTAFENKKMMSLIVQQCLKNIREPQKHVRMRLQLGMVGLGRRKKMGEASLGYEFDEFIDMLGHSQTEVSLGSIVHGGLTKSQLANIKAIELLDNPTMSYSAEFHLRDDAAAEPTLIIQHEWIENKSGEDLELDGRVWLSKAVVPEERPLEVIVIDFDRTDYQLHIDLASIYSNKNVRKQLEKFENSISFRRYTDAITFAAQPQPQSKFTWSTNNLQRVVDKTMMSFDIRGTTYKFAIMRSDTFTTDPMKTIRSFEQSTFAFYIFDPEWDVSLAEFGHLKAGQDVSWKRDLNTFFPKPWDTQSELTQPTDLNAGFHAFLELVEKVAGQLRHAIDTAE